MTHGEIWWVDFGIPIGSLPAYRRPVIIIQNDSFQNDRLNTTVVVPLTSNLSAADYKPNVLFLKEETNLPKDSVAVIHLIGAVNKFSFVEKIGEIADKNYKKLTDAITVFVQQEQL